MKKTDAEAPRTASRDAQTDSGRMGAPSVTKVATADVDFGPHTLWEDRNLPGPSATRGAADIVGFDAP